MKPAFFAVYSALLLTTIVVSAFQLMTVQALRAICMVLLSAGGLALLLIARGSTGSVNAKWQLVIGVTAAVAMVVIGGSRHGVGG